MKTFINNRYKQKICVVVENEIGNRMAFVEHGLGGYKDQKHIRAMIKALINNNYTVVSFDTTNTFGESEGDYKNATVTQYIADLEDVIDWSTKQDWFKEPYVLAGHSLGGISVATYAEKNPSKVSGLAPIATVVSGKLSFETARGYEGEENLDHWRKTGVRKTYSRNGKIEKVLKWSHMEDRLKYDLLPSIKQLTMPTLIVVGSRDDRTPPDQQQILFDNLPGPKKMHIIDGAEHSFYRDSDRQKLTEIFNDWLKSF